MLDECKGERLEEVLAVFSSAVLKKVVTEQQLKNRGLPSVAQTLALEKRGYSGEREELNVLILAHTVSLRRKLDQKNAARLRYKDFAQVLDSREQSIAGRVDRVKKDGSNGRVAKISSQERTDIRRTLRNNWAGNERWMEALLYGDAYARQDGLLSTPFDRVWRRVRSDRVQELEDKANGLLKQLDDRVRAQQERLLKWHTLKGEMFGDTGDKPTVDPGVHIDRQKGFDFGFGVHESLHLGRLSPRKLAKSTSSDSRTEYQELLSSLERDMKNIDQVSNAPVMSRFGRHTQPSRSPTRSDFSDKAPDEPISELSELEEEIAKASVAPRDETASSLSRGTKQQSMESEVAASRLERARRPRLPQPLSTMHSFRPKTKPTEISPTEPAKPKSPSIPKASSSPRRSPIRASEYTTLSPDHSPTRSVPPSPSWSSPRNSPPRRTQSPEELPPSPTQQQADLILASMNAASPSPVKQSRPRPTLSLADRTRLSMSRSTTLDFDDDDDMPTGSPTRPRRRNTSSRSPTKRAPNTPTTIAEDSASVNDATRLTDAMGEDDLVARTRKSMANFEAAQQKARLERQRSQKQAAKQSSSLARKKYFPAVGEESEGAADGNSTEVLEELIAKEAENQGADYDAIFKSRPKIKASPPGTPLRSGFSWDGED